MNIDKDGDIIDKNGMNIRNENDNFFLFYKVLSVALINQSCWIDINLVN